MRANELYLRYHRSTAAVINELGYPNCQTLRLWYMELEENGGLSRGRHQRYDNLRKKAADDRFFDRGQCFARAVRHLGYPKSKESLGGMGPLRYRWSLNPAARALLYGKRQHLPNAGVMVDGYRCLSCGEVSRISDA